MLAAAPLTQQLLREGEGCAVASWYRETFTHAHNATKSGTGVCGNLKYDCWTGDRIIINGQATQPWDRVSQGR